MVWADLDHDKENGESFKREFWNRANDEGIGKTDFDQVVFAFAKDRLENWIEYLNEGVTDEHREGKRVKHGREAKVAALKLVEFCHQNKRIDDMPASLKWSCKEWRILVERMH